MNENVADGGKGALGSIPPGGSDPAYGDFNTAMGARSLMLVTTGKSNTAFGFDTLISNNSDQNSAFGDEALRNNQGSFNTAVGVIALALGANGDSNTAVGVGALYANDGGNENTAIGVNALASNMTGRDNTATGLNALNRNTTGGFNTAAGYFALSSNTTGGGNVATGTQALEFNKTGSGNTATGGAALQLNVDGSENSAYGVEALNRNTSGIENTAIGNGALHDNTGSNNIALGFGAGYILTTGGYNIEIGNIGQTTDTNTIRIGDFNQTATFIAGINGAVVSGTAVLIDAVSGQLGTVPSSQRFKDAIKPMDKASEAILSLRPVTFHYKHELDPKGVAQFGLVAEEVEKVNPDLVVRDADGKVYSVRYEAVNAMLLNEFLKEHHKVEELEAKLAQQQKEFTARLNDQDSKIQNVSDKVELSKPAPRTVENNQ